MKMLCPILKSWLVAFVLMCMCYPHCVVVERVWWNHVLRNMQWFWNRVHLTIWMAKGCPSNAKRSSIVSLSFPSLCGTIRGSARQLTWSICAILKSNKQKQTVVGSNNLIGPALWVVCSGISLACDMASWSLWWGCVEIACACVSISVHWIIFIIYHVVSAQV